MMKTMIPCQCPACFHVFQADDRYAGTAVACHQCGTQTLVPALLRITGDLPAGSVEDATGRVVGTLAAMWWHGVLWFAIIPTVCILIALIVVQAILSTR